MSSLKKHFHEHGHKLKDREHASPKTYYKISDDILGVEVEQKIDTGAWSTEKHHYEYRYDFSLRIMTVHYLHTVHNNSSFHGENIKPTRQFSTLGFAQLDQEVLEFLHEKLIELKGAPPLLPNTLPKNSMIKHKHNPSDL